MEQLPLNLGWHDKISFANFYAGPNQQLVEVLQAAILKRHHAKEAQIIYLWGDRGSGRSHLLQACCLLAQQQKQPAVYLDLNDNNGIRPEILNNTAASSLFAVDNVEKCSGQKAWEEGLFHSFNQIRENNGVLIFSADRPPRHLSLKLADLKSRLCGAICFRLLALDDNEKLALLQMRANNRGMQLADDVGLFLLHRVTRDINILVRMLDKLDQASLARGRRLTVPFLKQVLQL